MLSLWRLQVPFTLACGIAVLGGWSRSSALEILAGLAFVGCGLILALNMWNYAQRYSAVFSQGFGPKQGPWQFRLMGVVMALIGAVLATVVASRA